LEKRQKKNNMHVSKISFNGNPNIGLYGLATDDYCLVSPDVSNSTISKMKEILKVPVYKIYIAGTELVGALCVANSNVLLVPEITRDEEIDVLERHGVNYKIINTKMTALGNNILLRDDVAMINLNYDNDVVDQLKKLKINSEKGKIAKNITIGSCAFIGKNGGIVHRDASEYEIKKMEKLFNVSLDIGTINLGNPYVKSGIITNSRGILVGELTSGYEITRVESSLEPKNG